jgi:hypothetical protein
MRVRFIPGVRRRCARHLISIFTGSLVTEAVVYLSTWMLSARTVILHFNA